MINYWPYYCVSTYIREFNIDKIKEIFLPILQEDDSRIPVLFEKQKNPAWIVFLVQLMWFIPSYIRENRQYVMLFAVFMLLLGVRVALTHLFLHQRAVSKKQLWYFELGNVIAALLSGLVYSGQFIVVTTVFSDRFTMLYSLLFFLAILGGAQTFIPSFLSTLGLLLGSFIPLILYYVLTAPLELVIVIVVGLFAFLVHLLISQYKLSREFIIKQQLFKEREEYIKQLENKLAIEEELKQQKRINIENAKLAALGEMSAGIAHEINNPLTIIDLNIKQLLKKIPDSKSISTATLQPILLSMQNSIKRASRIIYSLRIFARDRKLSNIEEIVMKELIDESLELVQGKFIQHDITLDVEFLCSHDVRVMANRVACSQVLINLLNNAFFEIEQTDAERWCKIVVETFEKFVQLSVVDSGKGIDSEIEDKIFTPFFTLKPPGQGTGLGLSLSKTMMQDMGGDLFLDNGRENTTFVVRFPISL